MHAQTNFKRLAVGLHNRYRKMYTNDLRALVGEESNDHMHCSPLHNGSNSEFPKSQKCRRTIDTCKNSVGFDWGHEKENNMDKAYGRVSTSVKITQPKAWIPNPPIYHTITKKCMYMEYHKCSRRFTYELIVQNKIEQNTLSNLTNFHFV